MADEINGGFKEGLREIRMRLILTLFVIKQLGLIGYDIAIMTL